MKKKNPCKRPLAALLALVLTLTLAPAAAAAAERCPYCQSTCEETVLHEANCHEAGVIKYTCLNKDCPSPSKYSTLKETEINDRNHDMLYTDNGDGTHSGVCREHPKQTEGPETHRFANGICEQCGAPNYSAVTMDLPAEKTVPIALGDTTAKLSAGDIRLTLGSANITDDYELSYLWYDYSQSGRQVGDTEEYRLPASIYGKEGTYYFVLVVNAKPKGTISRMPLAQTCRVIVQVDELITASAVITSEDGELYLGDEDGWSADSVSSQIYDAVQNLCGRGARPDYVRFNDVSGSSVGKLNITSTNT